MCGHILATNLETEMSLHWKTKVYNKNFFYVELLFFALIVPGRTEWHTEQVSPELDKASRL